jgi:hypothetical protein
MTGKEEGSSGHPNNEDKRLFHIPSGRTEMVELMSHMATSTSHSNSAVSKSIWHA